MDIGNVFNTATVGQIFFYILLAGNAFFLAKHFSTSDRLYDAISNLNSNLATLSAELKMLQSNDREKTRIIQSLMKKLIRLQEMFLMLKHEFESCKSSNCPTRETSNGK